MPKPTNHMCTHQRLRLARTSVQSNQTWCSRGREGPKASSCGQRRWFDCVDVQPDPSLLGTHDFVGFIVLWLIYVPAKACSVVPPMWQAATPVLAVANVCCGGRAPEIQTDKYFINYRNDPKFSDRKIWENSADPDQTEQSDQGLHCLLFRMHLLDTLLYGQTTLFKFQRYYGQFLSSVRSFRISTVYCVVPPMWEAATPVLWQTCVVVAEHLKYRQPNTSLTTELIQVEKN